MLARALATNASGRLLGYGGNWTVAARVAQALLPLGGPLELHAGVLAPVPGHLRGMALEVKRPQRRWALYGWLSSLWEAFGELDGEPGG